MCFMRRNTTMKAILGSTLAVGALVALVFGSAPTYAQSEIWPQESPTFVGRAPGMGPKCPPMSYHIVTKNKNELEGMAYTSNENGMEMYSVNGMLSNDGKVTMDLKPLGVGTPAKIEGVYKMGMLMINKRSGTCHVDEFMMMPVTPPGRQFPGGSG